jgi:Flp pilus assembly protein TadB
MSADPEHRAAPPAGEEIHLPGPSLLPFFCALGITLIIVGTTTFLVFTIVGAVIFLYTVIRWIRDVRRDIDALPEEHSH